MPRKVTRLGEKIKYYLVDRGNDQQDLASSLDITNSALSHKLSGKNPWNPHELDLASSFFGLNEKEKLELYDIARECNALSSDYEVVQRPNIQNNTKVLNNVSTFQAMLNDESLAPDPTVDFSDAEATYCHQIVETYKNLSFSGLGNLSLGDISVEQIFVHLMLVSEESESSKGGNKTQEEKIYQSTNVDTELIPINLAQALSKNVVIVGEPGAGKSALLRWLAVAFAQKRQQESNKIGFKADDNRLPIFIELKLFSDYYFKPDRRVTPNWMETLTEYISDQPNFSDLPLLFLKHALRQGRCLLLLDGLDEVVDQAIRRRLVRFLAQMAHGVPGNQLVISSRPAEVEVADGILFPQFQRCQIARFTPPQLQQFFRFWYMVDTHLPSGECRRKADDLYARVQDSPKLLEFVTTPLIATILLLLWRKQEALPNSRVQLYERYCHTLVESWEKKGHDVLHDAIFANFGWKKHLRMLAHLAYAIHKQEKGTHASEEYLIDQLANFFVKEHICADESSAKMEAEKSLRILGLRSALFQHLGNNQYGFLHLTLQQYLTARYIAEQPNHKYIDLVMEHIHEAWWREVHILVMAHLISDTSDPDKASKLMLTILNRYQPMSRWLCIGDLYPLDVLSHRPLLLKLLRFIRQSNHSRLIKFLLFPSLAVLLLPWITIRAIILYFCPVEWYIARLLEREYTLVVDGYLAAGFPFIKQQLSHSLYKHAQSLLFRSVYDINKINLDKEALRCVYAFLMEYFKNHTQEADFVIQKLLKVIENSPDNQVQSAAITSLGELGQKSSIVIDTLVQQLTYQSDNAENDCGDREDFGVDERLLQRFASARSLGKLGVYSQAAVDALIHALNHKNLRVREAAVNSLGQLANTNGRIIEILISILQNENEYPEVHKAIIENFGKISLIEPRILQQLVTALGSKYSRVRQAAINELVRLNRSNADIADVLINAINQQCDWIMHSAVVDCLVNAGKAEPEIAVRLVPHLNHSSSRVRVVVTETLIRLGNIDLSIEQVLRSLLTDDDPVFRHRAIEQVGKIGNVSEQTVEILTQLLLNDPEPGVRAQIARILGDLHAADNCIVQALILSLDDVNIRCFRRLSLRKFRQHGWQIDVEQMQKVSLDSVDTSNIEEQYYLYQSYYVAQEAALSLGRLGKTDDMVIHALIRAMHNLDRKVREAAAKSLGELNVRNDVVISALIEALNDAYLNYDSGEHPVAIAAAISLAKLEKTKEVQQWLSDSHEKHKDEVDAYIDVQLAEALNLGASEDIISVRTNKGAIENLIETGVPEKVLADYFVSELKHQNSNVRIAAALGLEQLGYLDENIVSALIKMVNNSTKFFSAVTHLMTTPASAGIEVLGRLQIKDPHQLMRVIKFLERHYIYNPDTTVRYSAFDAIVEQLQHQPFPGYRWIPLSERKIKREHSQFIRKWLLIAAIILISLYSFAKFNSITPESFTTESVLVVTLLTLIALIVAQFRSYLLRDPWMK